MRGRGADLGVVTSVESGGVFLNVSRCVVVSVVDEQNRHTQVQRMSSSSSIKRENSEELKDGEPRTCPFGLISVERRDVKRRNSASSVF